VRSWLAVLLLPTGLDDIGKPEKTPNGVAVELGLIVVTEMRARVLVHRAMLRLPMIPRATGGWVNGRAPQVPVLQMLVEIPHV
jgi:hypothetical protein